MCFSWSYTSAVQEVQARESKRYYCERNGFIGAGGTIVLCRMVAIEWCSHSLQHNSTIWGTWKTTRRILLFSAPPERQAQPIIAIQYSSLQSAIDRHERLHQEMKAMVRKGNGAQFQTNAKGKREARDPVTFVWFSECMRRHSGI